MDLPPTIYIGIGAVIAAFISGIFTYVNLISSKDQKISEFRQDWINGLRLDLSEFMATVNHVSSLLVYYSESCENNHIAHDRFDKFIHNNHELLTKIEAAYFRILLRINPEEDKIFISKLEMVHELCSGIAIPESSNDIQRKIELLTSESQILLKREWKKVKKGEPSYWITKYIALLFICATIIAGRIYFVISF